jgi:tetratricopeptide (TPR) repeat protein
LLGRYSENHLQDAMPYAEKAVALYPASSEALLLLARTLESTKQMGRVFNLIKKAVELTPDNPEAHYELGQYYLWHSKLERINDSVNEFRRALELSDGKAIEAWQGLGRALVFQGKTKEAIETFRTYLRLKKPSQYDDEIKQLIRNLEQASSR